MKHKLVVSIINFRTGDLTLACVQSVLDDIGETDAHIVVVDNFSDDGSAEQIEAWRAAQPETCPVTIIRSPVNSGFSGGHNIGVTARAADLYLILNSDAILRPGFIATFLAAAEAHPDAGLFAPKISYDDGEVQTSCFRLHSPQSELIRAAKTGPVTALLKRYEVALGPEPDPARIEWSSAACLMFRAECVAQVGLMDEGYFLYYEDAEYCMRIRRAGWAHAYIPEAVAVHYRGGSGPVKSLEQDRKRLPGYFYASRTRFLYQAHGRFGLYAANLAWHLGRGVAQLRRLTGRPVPPSNVNEYRDIWINATNPLGPRMAPWELAGQNAD